MLALNSAINAMTNPNIELILKRIRAQNSDARRFDLEDGFIAAKKWRLLEAGPFEHLCGKCNTLHFSLVTERRHESDIGLTIPCHVHASSSLCCWRAVDKQCKTAA